MQSSLKMTPNKGSFRDPAGTVYEDNDRVYRLVSEFGRQHYEFIAQQKIIAESISEGYLIPSRELPRVDWPLGSEASAYVLEHSRVPYVSYPYEWSFNQLKDAALHHLDFQLFLLKRNCVLKDASAYNIQFIGAKPVFIDLLSLAPYKDGDYWLGHSQFCEQFLNPLLLRSLVGITPNSWYRGRVEGIATADIARLIPFHKKFGWNIFTHIVLQARFDQSAIKNQDQALARTKKMKPISKLAYEGFLSQLRRWIARLEPKNTGKTAWGDYTPTQTYSAREAIKKQQFIAQFVRAVKPEILVDLGCNSGDYSLLALENGADYVVGFDFDPTSLDLAYNGAKKEGKPFLTLYLDASNPSPNQGWLQSERRGFAQRTRSQALIALAFIHHLAIAKNTPLLQLIDWLIDIAPCGVIEFIPKDDPTIIKMLALREDIFMNYNQQAFEDLLTAKATIINKQCVSDAGRVLYWYEKN